MIIVAPPVSIGTITDGQKKNTAWAWACAFQQTKKPFAVIVVFFTKKEKVLTVSELYEAQCYECGSYGDDYYEDEDGNLVCACETCPFCPWRDEHE